MRTMTEYECKCEECVEMCKRYPCRPLPSEVANMPREVRARLMIQESGETLERGVPFLQAAAVGHEGDYSPNFAPFCGSVGMPHQCTFLSDEGLCELHGTCKPFEGRVTIHETGREGAGYLDVLQEAWNNDEGREVLAAWRAEFLEAS